MFIGLPVCAPVASQNMCRASQLAINRHQKDNGNSLIINYYLEFMI